MSEIAKFRLCAAVGCNARMLSVDKDSHLLCPTHTGFVCNMDRRCSVCTTWNEEQMRSYCSLQAAKARKRAYRERKRGVKETGSHDISDSSLEDGKVSDSCSVSARPSVVKSSSTLQSALKPIQTGSLVQEPVVLPEDGLLTDGRELVPRPTTGGDPESHLLL